MAFGYGELLPKTVVKKVSPQMCKPDFMQRPGVGVEGSWHPRMESACLQEAVLAPKDRK